MPRKLTKSAKLEFRTLMRGGLLALGADCIEELNSIGGESWEVSTAGGMLEVYLHDDTYAHSVHTQFVNLPASDDDRRKMLSDSALPFSLRHPSGGSRQPISHKWNHYADRGAEAEVFASYVLAQIAGAIDPLRKPVEWHPLVESGRLVSG